MRQTAQKSLTAILITLLTFSAFSVVLGGSLVTGASEADYLLYEHHGGWWSDAEKTADNDDDDLMCWAASAANVLEWTGWGWTDGLTSTDEMFQYSLGYWDDRTGWPTSAWYWWFNNGTFADVPGGGEFWPGYPWTAYVHEENDPALALAAIDDFLHAGYAVAIGIWDGGHVITCWGFQYDDAVDKTMHPEDYYLGIWVTDSDDDKGWVGPAVEAPNSLRYLPVAWNGTVWKFTGGYGGWHVSGVCGLEPYPANGRPIADAGGPYVGLEGSPILFDGSGSSDPDGDPLMYRWDFDNDGLWDTGWSSSPSVSHTYADDYTGTVVLNVHDSQTDGGLQDGTTASVTVSNVDPIITVSGDTIDENGVATVAGTITDPSSLDTFTVTIDWGEGSPESYSYPAGSTAFSETHQYLDDDPSSTASDIYTVTVTVEDDDGGSDTASTTVTVNNVNPVIEPLALAQPNSQFILPTVHGLNFTGSFTDVGTLDTHTAVWDWGDSTTSGGTVIESGGSGIVTGSHTYSTPGVYAVTLTVVDDDTGVETVTMMVTVVTVEEAKHITNDYIQGLPASAFKGNAVQRKKAFANMFSAIDDMLADEEYWGAIQHLRNNIREKFDGHVDGKPGNDWITDPVEQAELCQKIDDITAYLETLL